MVSVPLYLVQSVILIIGVWLIFQGLSRNETIDEPLVKNVEFAGFFITGDLTSDNSIILL